MDAGPVQGKLIHALLRLVLAHESGVAVAAPAVVGHPWRVTRTLKPRSAFMDTFWSSSLAIAAVAVGATDRVGVMHVILEDDTRAFHDAVAIEAGILGGLGAAGQQRNQGNRQEAQFHLGSGRANF